MGWRYGTVPGAAAHAGVLPDVQCGRVVAMPALAAQCGGRDGTVHPCSKLGGRTMYDDFFDIRPNNKEMAALILIVFIILVAVFSAGYMLGISSAGPDVHDNGGGTAGAGQQIEQAGADIQHAADGIKAAERTADQIGSGIKDAKVTAGYIQSTANTSAELISECQSIIGQVRARGAQDAPKN